MKPSLYSLYKRGKYYRPPSIDRRDRNEVERFAVAAVAFCLEHDRDFRKHFWRNVCHQSGELDLRKDASIEVEEKNWSDLWIRNGDCLAVVEFKAGAPLEEKQNPMQPEFLAKGGYGHEMLHQQIRQYRIHHYTILGHDEHLGLGNGKVKEGISCSESLWGDLSKNHQSSGLVQGLFESLGGLGIKDFQLMSVRKIRIESTQLTATAANVVTVIEQIKSEFGLKGEYESSGESDESWWLGFHVDRIKKKAGAKNEQPLPADGCWFGFESDAESGHRRSVYIYGADKAQADKAKRCFRKPFSCAPEKDSGGRTLIITQPEAKNADYDWFESVFRKLGLKD